jgi:hypothetical protein
MKYFLLLCGLLLHEQIQALDPMTVIDNVKIIGMEKTETGYLLLSNGGKGNQFIIHSFDSRGNLLWESQFKSGKAKYLKKFRFLADSTAVYFLNAGDEILLTKINQEGQILYCDLSISGLDNYKEQVDHFFLKGQELHFVAESSLGLEIMKVDLIASQEMKHLSFLEFPSDESLPKGWRFQGIQNGQILSSFVSINEEHGEMMIHWLTNDLAGKLIKGRRTALRSENYSFAYYSSTSDALFEMEKTASGYLLIGKLDVRFEKKYLSSSISHGFAGFWLTKLGTDMEMKSFTEIHFPDYTESITGGFAKWEYFMDLKQGVDEELFVNFVQMGGIMASNHILFHLDSSNTVVSNENLSIPSGFFDYTSKGVRHISRKSAGRLVGDDWRYYATNFFNYLDPKSKSLLFIDAINTEVLPEKLPFYNYNVFPVSDGEYLFWEYQKKGTRRTQLKIYRLNLGYLKF